MKVRGKGIGADLSEESDWLLTHGVSITDVSLYDLSKGFLHSLKVIKICL